MIARYASAATSGAIITFTILLSMQGLIAMQPGAEVDVREPNFVSFVRIKPAPDPVRTIEKFPTKQELTNAPKTPRNDNSTSDTGPLNIPRGTPLPPPPGHNLVLGVFTDGPLVALVRVQPTYPIRASSQGLEGSVIVQFDVKADGRVTNAVVVESSHHLFDRPAIKAAERFKFKPRVVDGVALATFGIQNLFSFELDD